MSFLAKLGKILLTGAATLTGVLPIVQPLLGRNTKVDAVATKITDTLTLIGTSVVTIEMALNGKAGVEKFAALVNLVGPLIRTSELVASKEIADEAMFQKGINEIAQGAVDILNSLKESGVKTSK